jgi:response regulator NasT
MKTPRWRVVALDDHPRSRTELARAVTSAGGVVAAASDRAGEAVSLVTRARPDAAIFAVGLRDGDGVGAARAVMEAAPCPIVLLTSHRGDDLIERARAAGVMGYLLKPLRGEELPPALELAITWFAELRRLRRRLDGRKVIERAKGLLMARRGLSEDTAFRMLRRTAMDERRTIAEIARAVIGSDAMTAEGARALVDA